MEPRYLVILPVCIAVCVAEAITQSERDLMGAAGIEKRDSGTALPVTRTGAVVGGMQTPADVTRDFTLRQPAMQITAQDGADSSEASRPIGRFVISFSYSKKTYVPAVGVSLRHIGMYLPEVHFPFTVMETDTGSTGFSGWPLVPLAIAAVGEWLAGNVLGARWLQLGIRYIFLFPALALNSYHHLVLLREGGVGEEHRTQLTAFLGSRYDLWEKTRRWTPMAGFQYRGIEGHSGVETGGAFYTGIEAPVDLSSPGKAIPGFFVGLKLYVGGGD